MRAPIDEARLDAAIEALTEPERFRQAESVVAAVAPKLQRVLAQALDAGGWFGDTHAEKAREAATAPSEDERLTAVRTLAAEEARMGMMVGVAVGWALAEELSGENDQEERR